MIARRRLAWFFGWILVAGCAEPKASVPAPGGLRVTWPDLPASLHRGELKRSVEASAIVIKLDFFNVDFEWSEGNANRTARFLIPAVSGQGGEAQHHELRYAGGRPDEPTAAGFDLTIPGVPLMTNARLTIAAFAVGMPDQPILQGETTGVNVLPEDMANVSVKMNFTEFIDADADGYLPQSIGGGDCDDGHEGAYAGAPERCDGIDTACDGREDEVRHCLWTTGAPAGKPMQLVPEGVTYVGWTSISDTPRRTVFHDAFYIDRYEVSVADYQACVTCGAPAATPVNGNSSYYPGFANFPILNVSWAQANAYCAHVGKRLPTEFEWEVSGRGFVPDERTVPWQEGSSANFDMLANIAGYYTEGPIETTAIPEGASPFGVYNVVGNVAEWTSSWFEAGRYQTIDEALVTVPPAEPASGTQKVYKGGSWNSARAESYPFRRESAVTTATSPEIGFRCAVSKP